MQTSTPPAADTSPTARPPSPKRPRACPAPVILARGAEGVVERVDFLGRAAVRKTRLPKRYRHPDLDARLTARRLAAEARCLARLRRAGVRVPAVYKVDVRAGLILMEFVEGCMLKEVLGGEGAVGVCREAGRVVRVMHGEDVCHGDLTTSNVLVCGGGEVCLIDFGLAGQSGDVEEKAVDIYVLERAIEATHPGRAEELVAGFLEGYCEDGGDEGGKVMGRLQEVRARGRKRDMTG